MPVDARAITADLLEFIAESPSPFHAVDTAARRLTAAGFTEADLAAPLPGPGSAAFVRRGGTLVAWRAAHGGASPSAAPFRIVGAHTDSPNLRIKPHADRAAFGYRQLGVEVYGGVLLNSWLDRDLGLSGRISVNHGGHVEERLFRIDEPILRIPQLAIHLDRDVNERGLVLNKQAHLSPIWGVGADDGRGFRDLLADAAGVDARSIVAWDAMCHDLTPPALVGVDRDLVSAPRIDNLLSCHAALTALIGLEGEHGSTAVVVLFDHEEVGSTTDRGAAGAFLAAVLERISAAAGADRAAHLAALAASHCVSADGAHATHPNYPERHEPEHRIAINGGPVVKVNVSARYATDAASAAPFLAACAAVEVPVQWFVTRSDLACGSTIGPLTAAQLAVPTVDVGVAQLAMHSARELTGAQDPPRFAVALGAYFAQA